MRRAEERAAGLHEIGTREVVAAVNEKILLLGAERHGEGRGGIGLAEGGHEAPDGFFERLNGAQERRLFVEGLAGVGAEGRGDAQRGAGGVALDEGGGGGVPGGVAARLEGGAQAAGGEGGRVGLADDEVLAGEARDGLGGAGGLEEGGVLLGGAAVERLEPVREVRGAALHGPGEHAVRDVLGDGRVEGLARGDGREKRLGDGRGEEAPDGRGAEDVGAVVVEGGRRGRHRLQRRARGDGEEGVGAGRGHESEE